MTWTTSMTSRSLLVASELADRLRKRPVSFPASVCFCRGEDVLLAVRERSNGSLAEGWGAARVITESRDWTRISAHFLGSIYLQKNRVVDPDPGGEKFKNNNRKNARKMIIIFKGNCDQLHVFFHLSRAVDPPSFFADPDPVVHLNADRDPAAFKCGSRSSLTKFVTNYFMKSWKRHKRLLKKLKTMELIHTDLIFKTKNTISTNFLAFFIFPPKIFGIHSHA